MSYKITEVKRGALRTKAVQKVLDVKPKIGKKYRDRKKIHEDVFDLEDSVADNAKMISLLTSTLSRIYNIIPSADKDNMDADDRALIEYMFNEFKTTETAADVKFVSEGTNLVNRLLKRQDDIGNIIKNNK